MFTRSRLLTNYIIKRPYWSPNSNTNTNTTIDINVKEMMYPYKIMCDKILKEMVCIDELKFLKFRDLLYDIFIYNLDITDCIWYMITTLIQQKKIQQSNISQLMLKTYIFLKYYNNNYRPIYHLESYLFYLTSIIHGYK